MWVCGCVGVRVCGRERMTNATALAHHSLSEISDINNTYPVYTYIQYCFVAMRIHFLSTLAK